MDVQNLTISAILEGYKKKEFTVTDVVTSYLDRIEKIDPQLNSFITVTRDSAQDAAKKKDGKLEELATRPLFGVPIALKDMFVTRGIKTTAASMHGPMAQVGKILILDLQKIPGILTTLPGDHRADPQHPLRQDLRQFLREQTRVGQYDFLQVLPIP